jgi:Prohead core protein serine protease
MKLICELTEQVQCITEEKDGKKTLYIEGIFMQAGIKNKNGRVYPSNVMESEVGRYLKETVQQKRAYGELGHPEGPQINLHRVSHIIESLRMDGNNVIGRAKIVDTDMGRIAKGLLEGGANLGVSSRGLGSLKPNGDLMEVQGDFKIVTAADIVADPSAPDAFVRGIMENVDWVYQNGTWKVADQMRTEVKRMSKRELEESKLRLFKFFLKQL